MWSVPSSGKKSSRAARAVFFFGAVIVVGIIDLLTLSRALNAPLNIRSTAAPRKDARRIYIAGNAARGLFFPCWTIISGRRRLFGTLLIARSRSYSGIAVGLS